MMRAEVKLTVSQLQSAFGRAETEEDVRYLCDVAHYIGRELSNDARSVEASLRASMDRLEKLKARR